MQEVVLNPQDSVGGASFSDGFQYGQELGRSMRGGSGRDLLPGEDSIMVRCLLDQLHPDHEDTPVHPEDAMIGASIYGSPLPELIVYFSLHDVTPGIHRLHLKRRVRPDDPNSPENVFTYQDYIIPFFYAPK